MKKCQACKAFSVQVNKQKWTLLRYYLFILCTVKSFTLPQKITTYKQKQYKTLHLNILARVSVPVHVHVSVCVCLCLCVCMYVCLSEYMNVCQCVCVCARVYVV